MKETRFPPGQTQLSDDTQKELDGLVAFLAAHPDEHISIYGHTDSEGNANSNKRLSEKRAEAIGQYLIQQGIEKERLVIRGFGEQFPIADNDTFEGRALNRRIDLYLFKPFP